MGRAYGNGPPKADAFFDLQNSEYLKRKKNSQLKE